jgi:zinc transporter 9
MTTKHTNKSVIYAFSGNLFITFLKFIGFAISSSPSLFGEAMHSLADTCNQGLLWLGVKRSKKKADANHAYGYGAERFFWAVVSACGIFFLGAGVTIYHALESLAHPENSSVNYFIYLILLVSFIIESFTLWKAYEEIFVDKEESFKENLEHADPISIAVFYEDMVAVIGILVATSSIILSKITGNYVFDAVGSIVIGGLLALVAGILLNTNRKYLLGKTIPKAMEQEIIEFIESDKHIDKVLDFKSEILDMNRYHIKCEIEFNGYALVDEIFKSEDMEENFENLQGDYEEFKKFVIYQTNQTPRLVGRVIDNLEKSIRKTFPKVIHIDLEIN